MNTYNLPLDIIEEQWTANIVPDTVDTPGGIFLGARNDKENFVDTFAVQIPRPPIGTGLGIGLAELAGGREDGLGITVVSGLVEGGFTYGCDVDIMPGDCISSISVIRSTALTNASASSAEQQQRVLAEKEETITVETECLGYDATVDAILSLPQPTIDSGNENLVLKIKRLRRKPKVKVNVRYPPSQKDDDVTLELFAGENLRFGMLVRGAKVNDPLAKRFDTKNDGNCGAGGLCRTCSVSVLRGGDLLNPQKTAEKQMLQDNPRWRLACKAFVGHGMKEGEITIQVNPRQW